MTRIYEPTAPFIVAAMFLLYNRKKLGVAAINIAKKIILALVFFAVLVPCVIFMPKTLHGPDPSGDGKPQASYTAAEAGGRDVGPEAAGSAAMPAPTPSPTPTPTPMPWEMFTPRSTVETDPHSAKTRIEYAVRKDGETVTGYVCEDPIFFGMPDDYTDLGITTFRMNNFRNGASLGTVNVVEERLTEIYRFGMGSLGKWTGVGWTGQPAVVNWPDSLRRQMNLYPDKKEKDGLVEVVYGSMDGKIYFFDLENGERTRDPINFGEPIKGAVTVDPRGYPLLYVGQGDQLGARFGFYIYSLLDGELLYFLNGRDTFALRQWAAFDSNPLFDAATDRMYLCGENGVVYNIKLNTNHDKEKGKITIDPEITRYRYKTAITGLYGIENSPAAFSHYLFFGDNGGVTQCLDLRTFTPVWVFDNSDDSDGSVALDWEEDAQKLFLYTANDAKVRSNGMSYLRKLDAETGALVWEHQYKCHIDLNVSGGVLSSPVIGRGDISNAVIYWVAKLNGYGGGGALVAIDKYTGEKLWEKIMPRYGWSSPVAVYTPEGKSYLIVSDSGGYMHLIRGTDGEILHRINLGGNIEASPAVYGNILVVGTRGQRVYGIRIE